MNDTIIVFKERNFHFGLFQYDVIHRIPLDQIWISPMGNQFKFWKFEKKNNTLDGILVHLGSQLSSSPVYFSHKGGIFITKSNNNLHFGIFSQNIVCEIKIAMDGNNFLNRNQIGRYPPGIALESYQGFYRYKRKMIFIIDPVKFDESVKSLKVFPALNLRGS